MALFRFRIKTTKCFNTFLFRHGAFVLAGAVSPRDSQRVFYALGVVDVCGASVPTGFSAFLVITQSNTVQVSTTKI